VSAAIQAPVEARTSAGGLVQLLRPRQWTKNVLVFAAPAAAGVLHTWDGAWRTLVAFAAFCAAASAGYIVNDLVDLEADRAHPTKRHRPIAAGVVAVGTARLAAVVLFLAALVVASLAGQVGLVAAVAVYSVVVLLYSFELKRIAVVDLVAVAAGFVIRAIGGADAVGVFVSNWFLIVFSLGSLLVGEATAGGRGEQGLDLADGVPADRQELRGHARDRLVEGVRRDH